MKVDPDLLVKILGTIIVIFILGVIITNIYVLVKYGNTPVSEMPTWVWWWLKGNGGGAFNNVFKKWV